MRNFKFSPRRFLISLTYNKTFNRRHMCSRSKTVSRPNRDAPLQLKKTQWSTSVVLSEKPTVCRAAPKALPARRTGPGRTHSSRVETVMISSFREERGNELELGGEKKDATRAFLRAESQPRNCSRRDLYSDWKAAAPFVALGAVASVVICGY